MKRITNLFLIVFFILAVIKSSNAQDLVNISGKVRYSDNNEIVTRGVVKSFDQNGVLTAVATIQPSGDYILGVVRALSQDLIAFPNIDNEFDYFPTGYPNKIDPNQFVHVVASSNLNGVDIFVERGPGEFRPAPNASSVSGKVLNDKSEPLTDAVVYIKHGENYYGFGSTNLNGEFTIKNVPAGDFILVAHKVGSESDTKILTIAEKSTNRVIFNLSAKTGVEVNDPEKFSLSQNYPNPFNPSTKISFTVPADGFVTLKIYNSIGQVVDVLVNETMSTGAYSVDFNAKDLSSGIYYYRIETNGFTDTKKMILIK